MDNLISISAYVKHVAGGSRNLPASRQCKRGAHRIKHALCKVP
jgi:hypothetical protein